MALFERLEAHLQQHINAHTVICVLPCKTTANAVTAYCLWSVAQVQLCMRTEAVCSLHTQAKGAQHRKTN